MSKQRKDERATMWPTSLTPISHIKLKLAKGREESEQTQLIWNWRNKQVLSSPIVLPSEEINRNNKKHEQATWVCKSKVFNTNSVAVIKWKLKGNHYEKCMKPVNTWKFKFEYTSVIPSLFIFTSFFKILWTPVKLNIF